MCREVFGWRVWHVGGYGLRPSRTYAGAREKKAVCKGFRRCWLSRDWESRFRLTYRSKAADLGHAIVKFMLRVTTRSRPKAAGLSIW